jgi:hypothetical protein
MDCYYCIISTPEEAVADVCVLDAVSDDTALLRAGQIAGGWVWLDKVEVYYGERRVALLDYAQHPDNLRKAA